MRPDSEEFVANEAPPLIPAPKRTIENREPVVDQDGNSDNAVNRKDGHKQQGRRHKIQDPFEQPVIDPIISFLCVAFQISPQPIDLFCPRDARKKNHGP